MLGLLCLSASLHAGHLHSWHRSVCKFCRFNTKTDVFAFLLSTRAGGTGLNLTGADTVVSKMAGKA